MTQFEQKRIRENSCKHAKHEYNDPEIYGEMVNTFGKGTVVIDVITGRRVKL